LVAWTQEAAEVEEQMLLQMKQVGVVEALVLLYITEKH
jgi:hypothetical protein